MTIYYRITSKSHDAHPSILKIELSADAVAAGTLNGRGINEENGYFQSFAEAKNHLIKDQEASVARETQLLNKINELTET
jgi:hypothetical protein